MISASSVGNGVPKESGVIGVMVGTGVPVGSGVPVFVGVIVGIGVSVYGEKKVGVGVMDEPAVPNNGIWAIEIGGGAILAQAEPITAQTRKAQTNLEERLGFIS